MALSILFKIFRCSFDKPIWALKIFLLPKCKLLMFSSILSKKLEVHVDEITASSITISWSGSDFVKYSLTLDDKVMWLLDTPNKNSLVKCVQVCVAQSVIKQWSFDCCLNYCIRLNLPIPATQRFNFWA